jgi:NADH-quinone oxidoreductase subunit J
VTVFWLLAPVMVLAAIGMVLSRKAVHSALMLAVVMIGLAIMYAALDAPFLFTVQIIVYTGAVLMLFLFVLMLVGVDASDSLVETLKGQRALALTTGLLLGVLLIASVGQAALGSPVGLEIANADGNVNAVAQLLFSKYFFAFEVTSALLITAAIGAMVLAHQERLTPKPTQRDLVEQRMRDYAATGTHPGTLPSPGVLARHNAVGTPALLPGGRPSDLSVSRVLRARGAVRPAADYGDDVEPVVQAIDARAQAAGGPPPAREDAEPTGDQP